MAFKMPSNRRLHPQNSKVVNTAIETIKTTAPIAQERYWNAFRVNGYTCSVYNFLTQGKLCSCSAGTKTNVTKPILDEEGNAPREYIEQMLNGGILNGSFDYGEIPVNPLRPSTKILELDTGVKPTTTHFSTDFSTPNANFIEEDYSDDFLEGELGNTSNNKCTICYGSGFIGGFNLCFGNRFVLEASHSDIYLYGFSVHQENSPYSFVSYLDDAYVQFKISLPRYINSINALNVKFNSNTLDDARLQVSQDGVFFTDLTIANLKTFCTGQPIIIKVFNIESFTHLEIELNLSEQITYLEYPVIAKTGDVQLLDAIGDVQIYVSPLISEIKPKDIIVDNTLGKVWRVISVNDHKDRNYNIHGWEVNARLVQAFEMYSNLPAVKTIQRQLTTKLNR